MTEHIIFILPQHVRSLAQDIFDKHGSNIFLNKTKTKQANHDVVLVRLAKLAMQYPSEEKQLSVIIKAWSKPKILESAVNRALQLHHERKRNRELQEFIEREKEIPIFTYYEDFDLDLYGMIDEILTQDLELFLTKSRNNVANYTTVIKRLSAIYAENETCQPIIPEIIKTWKRTGKLDSIGKRALAIHLGLWSSEKLKMDTAHGAQSTERAENSDTGINHGKDKIVESFSFVESFDYESSGEDKALNGAATEHHDQASTGSTKRAEQDATVAHRVGEFLIENAVSTALQQIKNSEDIMPRKGRAACGADSCCAMNAVASAVGDLFIDEVVARVMLKMRTERLSAHVASEFW